MARLKMPYCDAKGHLLELWRIALEIPYGVSEGKTGVNGRKDK